VAPPPLDRDGTDPIGRRAPDERPLTREQRRRQYKREYMRTYLRRRRAAASPAEREQMRAAGREVQRRRAANPITRDHDRAKRRARALKRAAVEGVHPAQLGLANVA
jgi:hypothetical protein